MADAARSTVSRVRRVIVAVIIVAFGLAALGGIIVLLGGDLGSEAGRVLGTTAVIGAYSVAVLCCAALAGRRVRVFGTIGAIVSVLSAGHVIRMIWSSSSTISDVEWRILWSGIALTAAFALASLLLLLADRRRTAVRVGLWTTLGLFAVVLVLVLVVIWFAEAIDSEVYPRALGIAGILAALGAVVVPVLSLLMPEGSRAPHGEASLSPALAARLGAEAERRGITVEELVAPVLGVDEGPREAPPAP